MIFSGVASYNATAALPFPAVLLRVFGFILVSGLADAVTTPLILTTGVSPLIRDPPISRIILSR